MAEAKITISAVDRTRVGVERAKAGLEGLRKSAASLNGVLAGLGAGISVTSLAILTRQTLEFQDAIGKTAQRVGTTTEALSALQYAAGLADVDARQLQAGLQRLARTAEDAGDGMATAVEAFEKIGVDPRRFRDTADLFRAVVAELSKYEDGARKTAIAQELLGRSGAALIPLINGGAEGLAQAAAEAAEFGRVVDQQTAKQAETLNDTIARVGSTFAGLRDELVSQATPALQSLADLLLTISARMVQGAQDTGTFLGALRGIPTAVADLVRGNDQQRLVDLEFERDRIQRQLDSPNAGGRRLGATALGRLKRELAEINAEIEGLKVVIPPEDLGAAPRSTPAPAPERAPFPDVKPDDTEAIKARTKALDNFNAALKASADLERDYQRDMARLKADQAEDDAALSRQIRENQQSRFDDLEKSLLTEREAIEAELAERLQILRVAREQELATVLDYSEAEARIRKGAADKLKDLDKRAQEASDAARELGLTFSSAFEDAAIAGKSLGGVLQGLAQDIQRILLRKTVTEPLGDLLSGFFGDVAGSFFGGGADVPTNHAGGIVGTDSSGSRRVSPSLFASAPRFHAGGVAHSHEKGPGANLKADEVPAILQKGEGVFTRKQMANLAPIKTSAFSEAQLGALANVNEIPRFHSGGIVGADMPPIAGGQSSSAIKPQIVIPAAENNVKIELLNKSGTPMQASQATPTVTPEGIVVRVVLDDLRRNGPIRQAMGGM